MAKLNPEILEWAVRRSGAMNSAKRVAVEVMRKRSAEVWTRTS